MRDQGTDFLNMRICLYTSAEYSSISAQMISLKETCSPQQSDLDSFIPSWCSLSYSLILEDPVDQVPPVLLQRSSVGDATSNVSHSGKCRICPVYISSREVLQTPLGFKSQIQHPLSGRASVSGLAV